MPWLNAGGIDPECAFRIGPHEISIPLQQERLQPVLLPRRFENQQSFFDRGRRGESRMLTGPDHVEPRDAVLRTIWPRPQ